MRDRREEIKVVVVVRGILKCSSKSFRSMFHGSADMDADDIDISIDYWPNRYIIEERLDDI